MSDSEEYLSENEYETDKQCRSVKGGVSSCTNAAPQEHKEEPRDVFADDGMRNPALRVLKLKLTKELGAEMIEEAGGCIRQILITVTDRRLARMDETDISEVILNIFGCHAAKFLILPDYSPLDGRLHYHGIFTLVSYRDLSRLNKALKQQIGNTWIKMLSPKVTNIDYMTKIYEQNEHSNPSKFPERFTYSINHMILDKYKYMYRARFITDDITKYYK